MGVEAEDAAAHPREGIAAFLGDALREHHEAVGDVLRPAIEGTSAGGQGELGIEDLVRGRVVLAADEAEEVRVAARLLEDDVLAVHHVDDGVDRQRDGVVEIDGETGLDHEGLRLGGRDSPDLLLPGVGG